MWIRGVDDARSENTGHGLTKRLLEPACELVFPYDEAVDRHDEATGTFLQPSGEVAF